MSEEKSIFSKLKHININEDKPQSISLGKPQEQSLSIDSSLKNDISVIKEKILSLEKSIIDISKVLKLPVQNLKEELLSEVKKNLNQELSLVISELNKNISNLLKEVKNELLIYKEEFKNLNKNIQFIENVDENEFEKIKYLYDINFSKISEKINDFQKDLEKIENSTKEEFKKIEGGIENISLSLSKNYEKLTSEKIDKILEYFNNIEYFTKEFKEIFDNINKNFNKSVDKFEKNDLLNREEFESLLKKILDEVNSIFDSFINLKEKIYNDNELKDNVFLKKHLVIFIELESKLDRIKEYLNSLVSFLK